MAFALSLKASETFLRNDNGNIMLTMTLTITIINIFVNASMVLPLLKKFNLNKEKNELEKENAEQVVISA